MKITRLFHTVIQTTFPFYLSISLSFFLLFFFRFLGFKYNSNFLIIEEHNLIPFYITLLVVHKWFGIDVCEEREREREKERERERERERTDK